jgi:predicted  nucleic acid-binding Zn-ribbon protein
MSGGTSGEHVTASDGDVRVKKTFEPDEFPVPAVKFVVESEREEPVKVRLTDPVPESFPMSRIGFHPEFEGENWTAYKDQRVEYVRTLDPDESVTTVYGVRLDGAEVTGDDFTAEPTVEYVAESDGEAGADAVEAVVGEDKNQVVRDIVAGERDSVPGMDGDEGPEIDVGDGTEDSGDRDAGDPLADPDEATDDPLADPDEATDDPLAEPVTADDDPLAEPADGDAAGDDPLDLAFDEPESDADADTDEPEAGGEAATPAADEPLDLGGPDAGGEGPTDEGVEPDGPEPRDQSADATPVVVQQSDAVAPVDDGTDTADDAVDTFGASGVRGEETGDADGSGDGTGEADGIVGESDTDDPPETGLDDGEQPESELGPRPGGSGPTAAGGVAAALASEIRAGEVADDDLELLRSELDLGSVPSSVEARLGRLQSNVEDLVAYTDALETFLDEEGTGEEIIADLREEVGTVSGTVEGLAADLDNVESRVAAGERERESVDEELGEIREDIAGLDADVVDVRETVESELAEVGADLADLDAEVTGLGEDVSELDATVGGLDEDVSGLDDDLGGVESELSRFREELTDVREELEELEAFRDRLGDAFGGEP